MIMYESQEWLDAVCAKSRTDPKYMKTTKGFNTKLKQISTDCPGGKDIMVIWEFKDGAVSATRYEKPAPSDWRDLQNEEGFISTTIGDDAKMAKVSRGEANAQVALAKKWYTVRGNMLKVFAQMGKMNAFSELCSSIPCEFPDFEKK